MRRVALIYNPASGQHSARRSAAVSEIMTVLRDAGVEAEAFETRSPGSATTIAEQAVRDGFDTILACGGDGTVHEAVQSMVGTDVALGVVPLGTANALAADLGSGFGIEPRRDVGDAARGEPDHQRDRLARIILRRRGGGEQRERRAQRRTANECERHEILPLSLAS